MNMIRQRRKARQILLQALYSQMLSHGTVDSVIEFSLQDNANVKFDQEYFIDSFRAIYADFDNIDNLFKLNMTERDLTELGPIEYSILRLSTYEFRDHPEIPYKVIINEALDLAKAFGATESHKFINGVLDKTAQQLRPNEIVA